jgi:diguanylate cyclase (GGDEF)-like protein/PAS domain S-box-containing protein
VNTRLLHFSKRTGAAMSSAAGVSPASRSLAFYLACFLAAAVIPLFAVIVVVTSEYVTAKRVQVESYAKTMLDDIREEFDRDVAKNISMLRALATSPSLATGDLVSFHIQAQSLMRSGGVAIILRNPDQQHIVNTRFQPGQTPPVSSNRNAVGDVFATRRPYVSDIYVAERSTAQRVSITVPVILDDRVAYALSLSFEPSHFTELIRDHPLAESYFASVADRTGRIVSRSERADEFVGKPLPGFDKAVGPSGRWSGVNPQGVQVLGFYRRSTLSGWVFGIGVDQVAISKPLYDSVLHLALLCGLILLVGGGLTHAVRKQLSIAFAKLGSLAASSEDAAEPISTRITEVNFVGHVLAEAFAKLHEQAGELEAAKAELESKVADRTLQLSEAAIELAMSNARFEAAIGNMSQGLCMLDAEQKVVVCNARFREIYGLGEDQVQPGTTLTEILEHRRMAGTYFGTQPAEDAKSMLQTRSAIQEIGNGRTIRILRNPMTGGRFMTTHEDITDLKRTERELDETKTFLNTVIENMPVAIIAKDAATGRFVLVNRAYEEYIGVPRHSIVGSTVHDLYEPVVAQQLDDFDREAISSSGGAVVHDFTIRKPGKDERFATTTRMAVRNSKGDVSLLIVIIEDVTKKRVAERRIAYLAHHDILTGLANRATFVERIEQSLTAVSTTGGLAVHLVDLDRFKEINDGLGHAAGDELLVQIAHRLCSVLRPADICARIGGDEFAIIQADGTADTAAALANRVMSALAKPFEISQSVVEASASIGIAMAPQHGLVALDLMKRADLALYRAKALGRRGYSIYEDDLGEAAQARRQRESDLKRAVANREFVVHYQPMYEVRSGRPSAAEALVRWLHPEEGLINPNDFIPLAEETGLISAIGTQVLNIACRQATTWPEDIRLCVNVSPRQLASGTLADEVTEALSTSGLPASRLELEITETAIIGQSSEHLPTLRRLKALGVTVSLDDFGAGYSSLGQLTAYPFDRIKIDKSLIRNIAHSTEAGAVVVAVRGLAEALHIPTTAEGVETADQFRLLRLAGVQSVQGFLFARPMPADLLDFSSDVQGYLQSA